MKKIQDSSSKDESELLEDSKQLSQEAVGMLMIIHYINFRAFKTCFKLFTKTIFSMDFRAQCDSWTFEESSP